MVHPHVRGECCEDHAFDVLFAGSPPRAWGIRTSRRRTTIRRSVHPHVRREYAWSCGQGGPFSSVHPHMRGEYDAGPSTSIPHTVHPHVRGEYSYGLTFPRSTRGSPPRAWGIHGDRTAAPGFPRFTPTCVGNTLALVGIVTIQDGSPPRAWGIPRLPPSRFHLPEVHPHVRGEYDDRRDHLLVCSRFTPTCVGNTWRSPVR